MSPVHQEGRVRFTFPATWSILRPEDSSYYKRHFNGFCGGSKEMDFLAWVPDQRTLWMIEVKDYTTDRRTKTLDLFDELAAKVRDSLALLTAAAAQAADDKFQTRNFAQSSLPPDKICVALHLEQPASTSKLFPGVKLAADATQGLRSKVRCIDPRAIVVSTNAGPKPPWDSQWRP